MRTFWREKVRPWWYDYEWPVLGAVAVVLLALGYYGFLLHQRAENKPPYFWDLLFQSAQLFVLQTSVESPIPWQLNVARLLAPLVAGYTALQALTELFAAQIRSLRLRLSRHHVVICGLGHKGYLMAQDFLAAGERVVIVERDEENDALRQCQDEGALIILGDAAEPEVLAKARPEHACVVIAVCGDDGVNAQVALCVREWAAAEQTTPLTGLIHIGDPDLYEHISRHELAARPHPGLRLEYFNIFNNSARSLFNEFPLFHPGVESGAAPHLVVVGGGMMGESLVVQAARNWQPRFDLRQERLSITLIDPAAERKRAMWSVKHSHLDTGCALDALDVELDSETFHRAEFLDRATTVVVCLDDDRRGISTGLAVYKRLRNRPVRVVVCLDEVAGLPVLLRPVAGVSDPQPYFFGLLNRTWSLDLLPGGTHERLGRLLHEDYVAAQRAAGRTAVDNVALLPWDELSAEFKESNLQEADYIWVALGAVGCCVKPLASRAAAPFEFTSEEIETMARLEHERWMSERRMKGWNHGPSRDDHHKLNPNLQAWDQLPDAVREYNRQTIRDLPALLARAELQIQRREM